MQCIRNPLSTWHVPTGRQIDLSQNRSCWLPHIDSTKAGLTFKSLQQGFIRLVHWYVHLYHLLNGICRFHQQTYITHLADAAAKMGMSWNVLMSYIFHPSSPSNSLPFYSQQRSPSYKSYTSTWPVGLKLFCSDMCHEKAMSADKLTWFHLPCVSSLSICSTSTQQGLFFKIWSWDVSEKQKAANTKNLVLAANDCSFL